MGGDRRPVKIGIRQTLPGFIDGLLRCGLRYRGKLPAGVAVRPPPGPGYPWVFRVSTDSGFQNFLNFNEKAAIGRLRVLYW